MSFSTIPEDGIIIIPIEKEVSTQQMENFASEYMRSPCRLWTKYFTYRDENNQLAGSLWYVRKDFPKIEVSPQEYFTARLRNLFGN